MAVACSGGPDSFALLHALPEKNVPVVGLTVDHGLRPEAAEEAARVARWCAARDIPHEILVWAPSSAHPHESGDERGNLQAAARTARYRLLCEACNRLGIETLVTGHTADDQAETVFMRLRRGSGRGLAGMPSKRLIAGGAGAPLTLYRPLLGVRRTTTQAYAEAHDLPVSFDPSNDDEAFERVRVRALLGALEEQGILNVEALCRTAGEVERLTDSSWEHPAASQRTSWPDGSMVIDEAPMFLRDLERAIFAIGGATLPLPMGERSKAGARRASGEGNSRPDIPWGPIGGVIVEENRSGEAILYREPAALLGRADGAGGFEPIPAQPGDKHVFDRRFIVHVPGAIPGGTVLRPLGALLPRDIAFSTLDRQRLSTLPCLSRGGRLSHIPALCKDFIRTSLSGWKEADAFLDEVGTIEVDSLLDERFSGRVIRF